jgi:hypothetical protein
MSQHIFNSNTCRILFATCLSALCLIALSVEAVTITVSNAGDSGPGSLRQALADANDGDTIDFDSAFSGGSIALTADPLVVDKSVTISGPGAANLWVIGSGNSRVFYIGVGKTVTISGLNIANGADDVGGGIYNDHSTLTVSNCGILGNFAVGDGGGIYNDGSGGSAALIINNSTLGGNQAYYGDGGGIYNTATEGSVTVTVINSTLRNNSAGYEGGAICSEPEEGSETLEINNSTLSGNSAGGSGGGIGIYALGFSSRVTLTINNSTLNGNSASAAGGISNTADGHGGTTLAINNSTLSGNSASGYGGGIVNVGVQASATLTINNSTLSGNSASAAGGIYNADNNGGATLTIGNSILKTGASGENIVTNFGTVISNGYNLSNDNGGGFLTGMGDQINTDPMLGPLQDNGGPTFTHELLNGSPAIDAGDPNFNPNSFNPPMVYDQRGTGFNRVANGRIDIGAFEVQAVPSSYAGQVQQPINADGSSVFSVRRGVVPVKFTFTQGGVATCALPAATIAVTRTAGGTTGPIDESIYTGSADTGSNFRIDNCQYVYNLSATALGVGTYRVDILIDGQVVGSAVFQLK